MNLSTVKKIFIDIDQARAGEIVEAQAKAQSGSVKKEERYPVLEKAAYSPKEYFN